MLKAKTHKEVKSPKVSARHLADFMAGSEQSRRTIIRGCKYQPVARVIQHDEAKAAISQQLRAADFVEHPGILPEKAQALRDRLADSDFDRHLFDTNADYIDRYIKVGSDSILPRTADVSRPQRLEPIALNGVRVSLETHAKLQRLTRTNKIRVGAVMLRYAKGKALPDAVGEWQSAFLFGYLEKHGPDEAAQPEHGLCLTLDAYRGVTIPAPTDSVERFNNMAAACATIAERWPNIEPPPGAII